MGLGPEDTQNAWGSKDGGYYTSSRSSDTNVRSTRRGVGRAEDVSNEPRIVTSPKKAVRFPIYKPPAKAEQPPLDDPRKRWERNPRMHLASSTIKPKPKPPVEAPLAGTWNPRKNEAKTITTNFKTYYKRGDIPVVIEHAAKRKIFWKVPLEELDYHHYLPVFFEGLRETEEPYTFVAFAGIRDMLEGDGERVLPILPQLILPIKQAFNTKNRKVIARTLQAIQFLIKSNEFVGEALVPYYRQILPIMNTIILLEKPKNMGDRIDYSQQSKNSVIDLVYETLELMQREGGRDAFVNIRHMIPTFEMCFGSKV